MFGLPLAVVGLIGVITIGSADNVRLSQTYDMSKCTYPGAVTVSRYQAPPIPSNVRVCNVKK